MEAKPIVAVVEFSRTLERGRDCPSRAEGTWKRLVLERLFRHLARPLLSSYLLARRPSLFNRQRQDGDWPYYAGLVRSLSANRSQLTRARLVNRPAVFNGRCCKLVSGYFSTRILRESLGVAHILPARHSTVDPLAQEVSKRQGRVLPPENR
jgi:hypothetical protein